MLGQRLKEARKHNQLSQKQLAKLLNVSVKVVSNWERGTSTPSIQMCTKLCEALRVSANYLLGLDDDYMLNMNGLPNVLISAFYRIIRERKEETTN